MSTTEPVADNGVNVEHLLGARTALTDAPEAAEFTWRATTEWVRGTRTQTTIEDYSGLGREAQPQVRVQLHRRPPGGLRVRGQRPDARSSSSSSASRRASPPASPPSRRTATSS